MAKRPAGGGTKKRLRRGLWSPEEDEKLLNHIAKFGNGCWSSVPKIAGLERCGKSCRLRWINYLRPDLKRGAFSQQEEELIISLHSLLGNKWSQIAAQLPGRTDNEVKNFWNSFLKKKLRARGIDPATHKPLVSNLSPAPVFSDAAAELGLPASTAAESACCYVYGGSSDCGGGGHGFMIPSVSSSSTLSSMAAGGAAAATEEQYSGGGFESSVTTQSSGGGGGAQLPWLELGGSISSYGGAGAGDEEQYGAALDELRWSDYVFDGGYQDQQCAAAAIYDHGKAGGDPAATAAQSFGAHGGGVSWCLN